MGDKSQAGQRMVNSAAGGSGTPGAATGWRGAFMRKNLPRTLQILGATLQQIDNPQGQLDAFSANEADRQRQAALEMAQGRQTKLQDEQRGQLEQAISTLPPQDQAWARLNPEAFIRALAEARNDHNSGWNVGQGYSHAFRVGPDGNVIQGDALPLRPRQQGPGYAMPNADEWEPY